MKIGVKFLRLDIAGEKFSLQKDFKREQFEIKFGHSGLICLKEMGKWNVSNSYLIDSQGYFDDKYFVKMD
jgi:hypothetical protein